MHVTRYAGVVLEAESELAGALDELALRHAREPEIAAIAHRLATWSRDGAEALRRIEPAAARARDHEPRRLRRALFTGLRGGSFGLVRDLHAALSLASYARA